MLRSKSGVPPIPFVVEIEILPKAIEYPDYPEDPDEFDPDKVDPDRFATLYADEMGKVFFRRNASNARPMVEEIVQCLRGEVDEVFRPIQRALKARNAARESQTGVDVS